MCKYKYKQTEKQKINKYMKLHAMSNLPTNCCLKVDFQDADQYATGKRLIQHTKHIKDNQLQRLELQCRIS